MKTIKEMKEFLALSAENKLLLEIRRLKKEPKQLSPTLKYNYKKDYL
jgi:hypothetical protein